MSLGLDDIKSPSQDSFIYNFEWLPSQSGIVDEENDFYMIYMEQKRGGPDSPFNANVAQRLVYEAMQN